MGQRSIAFIAAGHHHLPLLAKWLRAPHMRDWWGEPDAELGYIRDMIEGRDTTRPFLIVVDGQPVGYIQYWSIGDHQNATWISDYPWLADLPLTAIGVDLSIGEADKLDQGIGSAALKLFTEQLADAGHGPIIIDPDPKNERALRAYRKAGFRPIPSLAGKTGDCVIMKYEAKANETL